LYSDVAKGKIAVSSVAILADLLLI